MEVVVIRALSDNFSYLLVDVEGKVAACVDAVEPDKVEDLGLHCAFVHMRYSLVVTLRDFTHPCWGVGRRGGEKARRADHTCPDDA